MINFLGVFELIGYNLLFEIELFAMFFVVEIFSSCLLEFGVLSWRHIRIRRFPSS